MNELPKTVLDTIKLIDDERRKKDPECEIITIVGYKGETYHLMYGYWICQS